MSKELRFYDKTILSTPNPVHSSSMVTGHSQKKSNINSLGDIPDRFDSDESLGILSFSSDESEYRLSSAGKLRTKEKNQAHVSLKECDKGFNITSIPSRYFKREEVMESTIGKKLNHTESTISETDLVPDNSSTPRESLQEEFLTKERQSLSKSIATLAKCVRSVNFDISNTLSEFQRSTNGVCKDEFFQSGSLAEAKLEEDEKIWKKENSLPVTYEDFSLESYRDRQLSVGSFFIKKSDDLPKMFARSPDKTQQPVALIETTTIENFNKHFKDSIDLSDIQKIISDQPTNHALSMFLNAKKSAKSKNSIGDVDTSKSKILVPEEVKENISPEMPKSILSLRSSSSLSSLPDGKLPIATTRSELIWGCVKLGKSLFQDFVIRNRSSSRLGIQCSVSNPSFRLNKDTETNCTNVMKITLHPYESRGLVVTFSPTTEGAAVATLNFTSTDLHLQQTVKQFIRLYGYGGFGNTVFENMIKDTSGKFLLSLGNIDHQQNLRQTFIIRNTGSLATFFFCDFILNNLYSILNVEVSPQSSILLPGETAEVVISYHLQNKDFRYFKATVNGCVIEIGKLQVYHGTEVNRARLRKVFQKAKEKNVQIHKSVQKILDKLPCEVTLQELKYFKESVASIDDVTKLLHKEDITITLEQEADITRNIQFPDETAMFQSLCENTAFDPLESCKDTCQVEPTRIILTPPDKVRDRIFVTNNYLKTIYFEINSSPDGLYLKPREGTIKTSETLAIDVIYVKPCHDKTVFKVKILVDNECFDVDVKVMYVKIR